ncbi:ABC-2 type transport system permease protein [Fontibacillus panacisegetis]|uniref:ABC-2 type transport system permease protein n=1 Tax=Fontibacillus panacisegetis TaxID=670482 RepID=A0A1G7SB58_9BACL|nr:ABC transporter permease [Fontibacillus panacisegetis]SDG20142.1 ABC-2 type transport system permease protein [Fontibacillus panacisegetis]
MNRMGAVIRFTFMNKVKTKSFLITTLVLLLLVTVGLNIPYFIDKFSGNDDSGTKIGIVLENQPEIAASLKSYQDKAKAASYTFVEYDKGDAQGLKQEIDKGNIDGYLWFDNSEGGVFPAVSYVSNDESLSNGIYTFLQAALQSVKAEYITKGALSDEQIAALTAPVNIESQQVKNSVDGGSANDPKSDNEPTKAINYGVVYILIILFFMTSMMTGNMIAAEVTAEKSSRIMEILITSVSPLVQMFGKILGMFLVGLFQILLFIAVIGINVSLPHNQGVLAEFDLNLSQINLEVLILGLIFYVLGYFLYATLFAAVGSLVSRTEELGQAVMPITMISLVAFYIGIFSMGAPNSLLLKVCSYIPFVSPVSMIIRVGLGDTPVWEIIISLLILVAGIFVFGWLSAKIYRTGVLLYGKRPTFKELRKAMKAYKI